MNVFGNWHTDSWQEPWWNCQWFGFSVYSSAYHPSSDDSMTQARIQLICSDEITSKYSKPTENICVENIEVQTNMWKIKPHLHKKITCHCSSCTASCSVPSQHIVAQHSTQNSRKKIPKEKPPRYIKLKPNRKQTKQGLSGCIAPILKMARWMVKGDVINSRIPQITDILTN